MGTRANTFGSIGTCVFVFRSVAIDGHQEIMRTASEKMKQELKEIVEDTHSNASGNAIEPKRNETAEPRSSLSGRLAATFRSLMEI